MSDCYLGTMNFGRRTPEAESKRILERALELGVRHIDTANAYTDGASERIVGQAIARRRDSVVVATKCGWARSGGKAEGLSRARILAAIDESLKRLQTDYVDVYYLHVPDAATPIAETLDAIAELIDRKKIRSWAVSNYASWQILEMLQLAKTPPPAMAQQIYNLLIRQLDIEYFAFARRYRLRTVVYNPLAGGLLTGRHHRDGSTQAGSRFEKNRLYLGRYFTDAMFDRVDALRAIAEREGTSLVELAYAWVSGTPGVDAVLLGPASVAQLEDGVAACARTLSPEVRTEIDDLHRAWMGTETTYVR